jgi:glucose/arabinose dehydrogenase
MPHKLLLSLFFLLTPFAVAQHREAWTTSNIHGAPEPPPPYIAESVWPHITFDDPLDMTLLDSENRLFVTERDGKVLSLPADLQSRPEQADLMFDAHGMIPDLLRLLGLEFHPDFKNNRQLYLYYALSSKTNNKFDLELSEFTMDADWQLVPGSQKVFLNFPGNGHTGGDIQFGPDGMLYIPIGDLTPPSPPDANRSGQNLSHIASKILRIDVNSEDPGLPYHIPRDNPFIDLQGARPEIWAYGFRNPWKLSFHPTTGDLWVGDVGWEMWEMIHRVVKGGNYGWSTMEGPVPTNGGQDNGPSPISPPVVAYDHVQGASVTGGYFVTSPRIPELQGKYVYGDYVSGKIWALDWNGKKLVNNREAADTRQSIVTFGQDNKGDLLFLKLAQQTSLQRLIPNPAKDRSEEFPTQLSKTGIFKNVATGDAAKGVYDFNIHSPIWHDGYDADYWVAMPDKTGISTLLDERRGSPVFNYGKPKDMVLAKTIHKDGHKVETQILHFDGYWKGYSYQWNKKQTDATLVRKEGLDTTVLGKPYRFPGRDECIRCHGSNFNRPLAFFPGQMNLDGQLEKFQALGIVDDVFVDIAKALPLTDPRNETQPIELRARSWLHSNCSHCHKVSGGSGLTLQMNAAVPREDMELIDFQPTKGYFGLEGSPQIDPGDPYNSILYYRIATRGAGHMPMIGAKTIDKDGVRLIHDWIRSLKTDAPTVKASMSPKNVKEALALYHSIQSGNLSKEEAQKAIAFCVKSNDPYIMNLFAAFELD